MKRRSTAPMQVVVAMGGSGARFRDAGYRQPKPLLDVAGRPLIARLLEQFPPDWRFVFICRDADLRDTELRRVLSEACPAAEIVAIAPHKLGPVHTVLEGAAAVDETLPTLINYCDFSFSWDPGRFLDFTRKTAADGAILCYRGFQPHYLRPTLYAYCREEAGRVLEVREKGHFTPDRTQEYASSGSYYFSSGRLALDYFRRAVKSGPALNGEFYVSLVYNLLIRDGLKVLVHEIPYFLQWGTPDDLEDYLYWHRTFERLLREPPSSQVGGARLLMPMAGLGSRFSDAARAKPLIAVGGRPMFLRARERIPCGPAEPVLVVRREIADEVRREAPDAKLVVLDAPTAGQAMTTLEGIAAVGPEEPVLVSACDHGLLWDKEALEKVLSEKPDLVVFGQRGYPDAARKPQSYSFIDADAAGRVRGVSVKAPLTREPRRELLLVGTFFFKSAELLKGLIGELVRRDLRVNNELYLDSVVAIAVEGGLDVRAFETRAYLNWGSPEALAEFSYWHGYFGRSGC